MEALPYWPARFPVAARFWRPRARKIKPAATNAGGDGPEIPL